MITDYNKLKYYELQTLCSKSVPCLSPSGNKADLVTRLVDRKLAELASARAEEAERQVLHPPVSDPNGDIRSAKARAEYAEG
jgi:hypothetical protein